MTVASSGKSGSQWWKHKKARKAAKREGPIEADIAHSHTKDAQRCTTKADEYEHTIPGQQADVGFAVDSAPPEPITYAFPVDQDDHCETCPEAYQHIAPLLAQLASALGKAASKLRIYDPYFCQGSVAERLAALGFPRVYNKNEDFYNKLDAGALPKHHVLLTNPPYSGDHVERLFKHCTTSNKPYLLLLPNWVYLKPYYVELTGSSSTACFITPPKRYHYYSPRASRSNVRSCERKTSPFITFWYMDLKQHSEAVLSAWAAAQEGVPVAERCTLVKKACDLPYSVMDSSDPLRKRERDRRRSIERQGKKRQKVT